MSFFDAIDLAASGLTAERMRMDVTSENLANAQTTQGANGQPYQRQEVVLQQVGGNSFDLPARRRHGPGRERRHARWRRGGGHRQRPDARPARLRPGHPGANAQGYVKMPNVNPVTEMTDLISESNSYQADVTAMSTAKTMYSKTLDLLK